MKINISESDYNQLIRIAKSIDSQNYMDLVHDHLLTGKSMHVLKYDYLTVNIYDTTIYEGTGKVCNTCNEIKPVACFYVSENSGKKYLRNRCLDCDCKIVMAKYHSDADFREKWMNRVKKWNLENRDKVLQKKREYYYNNRDKELERFRIYREKNKSSNVRRTKMTKSEELERRKQYRIENADVLRQRDKKYYMENREIVLERKKNYYQNNKTKILEKIRNKKNEKV